MHLGCGFFAGCNRDHQDDIRCAVGDSNLNLHVSLESWEGGLAKWKLHLVAKGREGVMIGFRNGK